MKDNAQRYGLFDVLESGPLVLSLEITLSWQQPEPLHCKLQTTSCAVGDSEKMLRSMLCPCSLSIRHAIYICI